MKYLISFIFLIIFNFLNAAEYRWGGGDDAGNGGFAYKQSIKILKLAADGLESKIQSVDMPEFKENPNWRVLLTTVLKYENLDKSWIRSRSRNGQPLAMDYSINKPKVYILKYYYQSFMGKTENEIDESVLETQKRLIHEASHIWGYNETASEEFAERFLIYANNMATRMSKDIKIQSNYCSCLEGRSDTTNDCNSFCKTVPSTVYPVLYLETVLGNETLKNPNIKNLYDWCNRQLEGDVTSPLCTINATDGIDEIDYIPVTIKSGSNKLKADISSLKYNTTYTLKLVESKTGSNAETLPIQIRRVRYQNPDDQLSMIQKNSVNQFSCLSYFGNLNPNGTMNRLSSVKNYFYYPSFQIPKPIPTNVFGQSFVCHDEIIYGDKDSALYPRLETVENKITLFDQTDPAFIKDNGQFKINTVIHKRLFEEYNTSASIKLINSLALKSSDNLNQFSTWEGYFVNPFTDSETNKSYCPSFKEYNSGEPLFTVMKDYFSELEAFYVAEGEPIAIKNGDDAYKTFYPNQFVRELDMLKYAFTVKNGLKEKVNIDSIHKNTVYFYYPFLDNVDPLIKENRILFTVRRIDELNEQAFKINFKNIIKTSDKRLGCIPKK